MHHRRNPNTLSVGNPYNIGQSLTRGIISGKPIIKHINGYYSVLQTDAAANQGNSGGPLLNTKGELIGINFAISSKNGGFSGISFSIPIENIINVLKSHEKGYNKVLKSWQGIEYHDLIQKEQNDNKFGIKISQIAPKSPLYLAGVRQNDIIAKIDNQKIFGKKEYEALIRKYIPSDKLQITIMRQEKMKTFDVEMKKKPERKNQYIKGHGLFNGFTFTNITEKMIDKFPDLLLLQGIIILSNDKNNFALKPGDIILNFNKNQVVNPKDIKRHLAALKKQNTIMVQRGSKKFLITINLNNDQIEKYSKDSMTTETMIQRPAKKSFKKIFGDYIF